MTRELPAVHAATLAHILSVLGDDARIDAVLAGGSMLHGGFDAQSDLDLVVVVRAGDYPQVMAQRPAIAARLGSLLAAFSGEHVGEPRLLICLFGPPLIHVDLKFVVETDLQHMVERPCLLWARQPERIGAVLDAASVHWPDREAQWFEDRAWIWLHYGAAKLLRGERYEALGMLAYFRDQVLGPLLHRRSGRPQRGVRRIESDAAADAALSLTMATVETASIAQALLRAIELYLELRQDDPPERPTPHMPDALRAYLQPGD
ncbi:hypothetical protein IP90_02417 [Luteimonas cucumeris]|uniref:Nucleotidyltransferase-like protein n=1 Tax=Luteimonas cucumeris TaxID=985012 RepID=A0A562L2I6_9GAMM|nr:nucleotidyltransferase domain-containing protein [Luteimonas cucumeris]TWI01857.1 hypothetical protein IP90_02417 [Luteimonas cucumeris]